MKDSKDCRSLEQLITLYACQELEGDEKATVEEHIAACSACAASLEHERRLLEAVSGSAAEDDFAGEEASRQLLARCREDLNDALDRAAGTAGWTERLAILRPSNWVAWARSLVVAHPAWSAAVFALFGFLMGQTMGPMRPGALRELAGGPVMTVSASALSDQDLRNATVSGINWMLGANGGELPTVEIRLRTARPVTVRGTTSDQDVKKVLLHVVQNDDVFDAGLRLDSLEVLRTQGSDNEVRAALCAAARRDRNTAVRLKALEALRGFEGEESVRQVFLDAILRDSNPGVRIAAVNAIRAWADSARAAADMRGDPEVMKVLSELIQNDSNTAIRVQSAGVVRELSPREQY